MSVVINQAPGVRKFGTKLTGRAATAFAAVKKTASKAKESIDADVKPYPLQLSMFAGCCGARVLHAFPSAREGSSWVNNKYTKVDYLASVDAALSKHANEKHGGTMLTLNDHQAWIEPLLVKRGWVKGASFVNPNSYHRVTTWSLDLGFNKV